MDYINQGEQIKTTNDSSIHETTENHSSWGMIGLSRITGSTRGLFGTSIEHSSTIRLSIKRAEKCRGLNRDWFHAKDELIEVELSASQFAELITNMNMGDGVPCTLRRTHEGMLEYADEGNKIDLHTKEFKNTMSTIQEELQDTISEAEDVLTNKKSIGKGDREKILGGLRRLMQQVKSNLPFAKTQFDEQMDKTVTEAKAEVESFITNAIQSTGIQAIKDGAPVILNLKEDNREGVICRGDKPSGTIIKIKPNSGQTLSKTDNVG